MFVKGQSGNPKGRKVEQISKELWRRHGPRALEIIVQLANSVTTEERVRLDACKYISDQAFGKAIQAVEGTGEDGIINIIINRKPCAD